MDRDKAFPEFEVIDQYGARWRYKRNEGYSWNWGLLAGTIDGEDRSMVEVWMIDLDDIDSEAECIAYFPNPAMVGDVTENTCMNFSMRELPAGWSPPRNRGRG